MAMDVHKYRDKELKSIVIATLNADNTNKLLVQFITVDIPCTPKHFTKKEHIMIRDFGILIL
jgi:hypothetical protein